ncbi:MAG: PEP-CTERM sorting domain-containing protein [Acidobacteria bacterium]|nr:PEP-CTERM sorting domain-containing protein [Acidobacteriota bacterium]
MLTTNDVPEPATLGLVASSLAAVTVGRRRRKATQVE